MSDQTVGDEAVGAVGQTVGRMWLPREYAVIAAVLLGLFGVGFRNRLRRAAAASRETAIVLVLYALWRTFNPADLRLTGGVDRAFDLWQLERAIGLGTERWLQQRVLGHAALVQAANIYYAVMHVPAMIAFLIWMFFRHRDRYLRWRTLLAVSTAVDVVIRIVPVAPPRLLPSLGFVDTAVLYGQSVYGRLGGGVSDQLAAMPSIHAGWAIIVAVGAATASRSRWRWIGTIHAVLTMLSVVVTANHWWLDCIVAGLLLVPLDWAGRWGRRRVGNWLRRSRADRGATLADRRAFSMASTEERSVETPERRCPAGG